MQSQFIQLFFLLGHEAVCLIIQLDCFILKIILAIQLLQIQVVTVVVVEVDVVAVVVAVKMSHFETLLSFSYCFLMLNECVTI